MKYIDSTGRVPKIILNALNNKVRKPTAFASATTLFNPTKIFWLTKRHWDEIEIEASKSLWALIGTALHKIIEDAAEDNSLTEERLVVEVLGRKISCIFDLYDDNGLHDYKYTNSNTYNNYERRNDYRRQLGINRFILKVNGFDTAKTFIVYIIRDWMPSKLKSELNYPVAEIFEQQENAPEITMEILENRVKELVQYETVPDDEIPECTEKERWQDPPIWAVRGEKRAINKGKCTSEEAAIKLLESKNDPKLWIEYRQSIPKRCLSYCDVAKYCNWYKNNKDQYLDVKEEE